MYIYNKRVGINMRKPFADGDTGEETDGSVSCGYQRARTIWLRWLWQEGMEESVGTRP